jgi:uracil-DNA glycosylase family 4
MYSIDELKTMVDDCKACDLGMLRKNAILDDGYNNQKIMLVGEAPGEAEDNSGRPFVGPAGKLLDDVFKLKGIERKDIYICNVLKCRPTNNATPTKRQTEACTGFLERQIETINPSLIISMGNPATKIILRGNFDKVPGITFIHGNVYTTPGGRTVIPVYHTAYVLRNEDALGGFMDDMDLIAEHYRRIYNPDLEM